MNNYIYHGSQGLITLPERNVQTFPSGLVRIDRVYACRKTLADRFRRDLAVGNPLPFDDGAPAIDGAFIFPDPQEVVRDDGFAEFRVSAYGRTNTIGSEKVEDEYITESISVGQTTAQFITRSKILTQEFVTFGSESVAPTTDRIPETPEVVFQFEGVLGGIRDLQAGTLSVIGGAGDKAISLRQYRVALRSYTARNFGLFSEVTVSYGPIVLLQLPPRTFLSL
jgi:hypothetical protein